jgi:hypothetical protein
MSENHVKELFKLEIVTDNPLFEGFAVEDAPSVLGCERLRDDISPGPSDSETSRWWQPVRLANLWTPPRVNGRVAPYQDFPGIDMVLPAFSRRAVDALRDYLEPNGELLRLDSKTGEYYFYNITTIVDALDLEKSDCDFFSDRPWLAFDADYFAFDEGKLAGTSIFRLVDLPVFTIVTNSFVERVRECGLHGFHFERIWPFPPGVNWHVEASRERRRQNGEVLRLKRQTVVVLLPITGDKPNSEESARFMRFEDALDNELAVSSLDAPYFGRYEGHEIAGRDYRVFLSCPNAPDLAEKLLPIVKQLRWMSPVRLIKRSGEMRDASAAEEMVEVQ